MLHSPRARGQGLVEYALILILITLFVIASLVFLGPIVANVLDEVIKHL